MYYKAMIFVFFVCFTAANVFSSGNKDNGSQQDINKLKTDVSDLKTGLKNIQSDTNKTLDNMNQKLDNITKVKYDDPVKPSVAQSSDTAFPEDRKQSGRFVPITWETAVEFEYNLDKLDFYVSSNLTLASNDQDDNSGLIRGGKIVDKDKNLYGEQLIIESSKPVKTVKFSLNPKDKASIEIFYSEQSALLKFIRNTKDCFELYSARINTKNYDFDKENAPLLFIYDERNQDNRISDENQTDTAQMQTVVSSRIRPLIPEDIMLKSGQSVYLTKDAVVEYILEKGGLWDINDRRTHIEVIVKHYINEAETENINHDIAIAQMCYATQILKNKTLFYNMNYAGLSKEGAVWNGKSWDGTFTKSQTGVRAHIQHLKYYASLDTVKDNVDPRLHLLANLRGKGDTLHKLCAYWVGKDPGKYERNLRETLEDLYMYQESYNKKVL